MYSTLKTVEEKGWEETVSALGKDAPADSPALRLFSPVWLFALRFQLTDCTLVPLAMMSLELPATNRLGVSTKGTSVKSGL